MSKTDAKSTRVTVTFREDVYDEIKQLGLHPPRDLDLHGRNLERE